ncbi:hypothetical protein [Spirosoma sordidisoli]|uniref:Uncharacterized protein n=1 Tax=Spirosoma sordidisoli TaxID=2502893 RepID=A0A4Q2UHR1_9BACT|nr:hypothetical protein [Spirosoma sordidisoli]RYC66259.1 hypothetical protein EQG79_30620 [Spirosoma sordidisoli]
MGVFSDTDVTRKISDDKGTYNILFPKYSLMADSQGKVWMIYAPWDNQTYVLMHDDSTSKFISEHLDKLKTKAFTSLGATTGAAIGMPGAAKGMISGGIIGAISGWGVSHFLNHLPKNYSKTGYYSKNGVWAFDGPIYY